jgi:hypothetical protein
LEHRFGLGMFALLCKIFTEIARTRQRIWMLGPEHTLLVCKELAQDRLGLGMFALAYEGQG